MGSPADHNHRRLHRSVPSRIRDLLPELHHEPPLTHTEPQVQGALETDLVGQLPPRNQHDCDLRPSDLFDPVEAGLRLVHEPIVALHYCRREPLDHETRFES